MRILKTNTLYCFSPPVMLITFVFEIGFALYVLFRYKLTSVSRLVVMLLVGLATFQLAEYNVCTSAFGLDSVTWSRIGYVAITLLPPVAIHLTTTLAGKPSPLLVGAAYTTAAIFVFIFLFVGQGILGEQCLGNYVIFKIAPWAVWLYAVYYYGWLLTGTSYAIFLAQNKKRNVRLALHVLAVGYLSFLIPTTTINILDPTTVAGIPSIMCGFAVLLALILTFGLLPIYQKNKIPQK